MAKSPAERKREQRERDRLSEQERLDRLLAKRITIDLYHATDSALTRCMRRAGIEEPQDLITRLIHNADLLDDENLARVTSLSRQAVTQ